MAFADDLKALLWPIRSIPGQLGLYKHTVSILNRYAFGGVTGDVDMAQLIPLTEQGGVPPKCEWLNDEELALSGLGRGAVDIGPITPAFEGGGTDIAVLNASRLEQGDTLQLLITGPNHPNGAVYKVVSVKADKALHYTIRATPVSNSPD